MATFGGGGEGSVTYIDGVFYNNGVAISGVASYTWAQFIDAGFDLTLARFVHISDRHSTTDGTSTPGSLWRIDPSAVAARKRNLVSDAIYYSTYLSGITEVPAASWPNMKIRCADLASSRVTLISNGTRYLPDGGRAFLGKNVYGRVGAPTKTVGTGSTTFQFDIGTPTFPANLFATPDTLIVTLRYQRHNANATMVIRSSLGTAGDATDDSLYSQTIAATDALLGGGFVLMDIVSSTYYMTNSANSPVSGGAALYIVDKTTNFNTASIMKLAITGTKNTNDTIDLLSWSIEWVAA